MHGYGANMGTAQLADMSTFTQAADCAARTTYTVKAWQFRDNFGSTQSPHSMTYGSAP